jgi:hypothetical protein
MNHEAEKILDDLAGSIGVRIESERQEVEVGFFSRRLTRTEQGSCFMSFRAGSFMRN